MVNQPKNPKIKAKPRAIIVNPIVVKPQQRWMKLKRVNEGLSPFRQLANMNPDYPYTPYAFYTPPNKYTEMPYQITNYTGPIVPSVSDSTPKKDELKQKVMDETQINIDFGEKAQIIAQYL